MKKSLQCTFWLVLLVAVVLQIQSCGSQSVLFDWNNVTSITIPSNNTIVSVSYNPPLYFTANSSLIQTFNISNWNATDLISSQNNFNGTDTPSALFFTNKTLFLGSEQGLVAVIDPFNHTKMPILYPPNGFSGVSGFYIYEDIIFIVDTNHHRVLLLHLSTYNYSVIGQPDLMSIHQNTSSFRFPTSIKVTRNMIFVVSQDELTICGINLNYNSTCQSIVRIRLNNNSTFGNAAQGLAVTETGNTVWVGDYRRVLRFTAPFSSYSTPDGVLGYSSFTDSSTSNSTTSSTFGGAITDLFYDDDTQILGITDRANNRLLFGRTSPLPPGTILYGDFTFDTTTKLNNSVNYITGSLILTPRSLLSLNSDQKLNVGQNLTLSGGLELSIPDSTKNGTSIELISAKYVSGKFSDIILNIDGSGSSCLEGKPEYGQETVSLLVLVDTNKQGCGEGSGGNDDDRRKVIIGVTVGVVGCVCLFLIGAIVVLVILLIIKKTGRRGSSQVNL
eukprot:TRINITY_DN3918_c0_g1_i1.p1 TRINITY_DN3918_c0_g1~~TRINITY_DN3918_c0_g1_i1.p1  ORF type:complete len:502 (-),score=82.74 TRINITY_DN3918_c0_g1_i1:169-1674(-)